MHSDSTYSLSWKKERYCLFGKDVEKAFAFSIVTFFQSDLGIVEPIENFMTSIMSFKLR